MLDSVLSGPVHSLPSPPLPLAEQGSMMPGGVFIELSAEGQLCGSCILSGSFPDSTYTAGLTFSTCLNHKGSKVGSEKPNVIGVRL